MSWFTTYVKSSIGAKQIVALSGLALMMFLIAHMLANLQIFLGPDAINQYGVGLREMGGGTLIWIARIGLLVAVAVHIAMTMRLAVLNRAARPVKYHHQRSVRTNVTRRTMALTGLALLAFIVYHLLHFTFGYVQPDHFHNLDAQGRHDVHRMMILSFQQWPIALSYIVAMALLCMHLAHGASSWFQSLGMNHPKYNGFFAKFGPGLALLLFLGFTSIPVAILAGLVDLPGA